MKSLIELWQRLMDGNTPLESQFLFWLSIHTPEVLREAIIRTATKNAKMDGKMDLNYRLRFCSRVANDLTFKRIEFMKGAACSVR
jgi:hypothetical protein